MNNILLLSEITIDDIVDTYWYKVYPTKVHRDNDSPWFFPGRDLRAEIEIRKKVNHEAEIALLWGKK